MVETEKGMEIKGSQLRTEVVSAPEAVILVEKIILTDEQRASLTVPDVFQIVGSEAKSG